MPSCYTELRLDGKAPQYIAKAAHILGEHDGSARFDASVPLADRNKIENLILMCPSHHDEIDADETKWTVERLRELKAEHESAMYQLLLSGRSWRQKFIMIDYLNVPRISGMPGGATLLQACRDAGLEGDMTLRDLGFGVGHVEGAARRLLAQWDARATPFDQLDLTVPQDVVATIVSFDTTAYTCNCPLAGSEAPLTGDLAVDPHIWFMASDVRVSVRYDPTWITTGTAIANLSQGRGRFAGIGVIVSADEDSILISALALGLPKRPEDEALDHALGAY